MFVALDLPGGARVAIARWRDRLIAGRDDVRPVPPDHLHVTLAFLGWQDESAAERIAAAAFAAGEGFPTLGLAPLEVRSVPPRDPRLFALDLADADGNAAQLQAAVAAALERERVYRPERRPFWVHLTLARVKRARRRVSALAGDPPPPEPFAPSALTLYQSTLRPQGALYEPLARRALRGG